MRHPAARRCAQDLGVDTKTAKLIFSCHTLAANSSAKAPVAGRHLLDDGHHHHHHDHDIGRKMLGLPLAEPLSAHQRSLLQLVQANLADPTRYPNNSMTLPLLHSRPTATRKIFLDFDGHTAV
jgi:hypothetical protein